VNLRAAGGLIVIGDDCLIANAVTIVSSNHGISADALILKQPWSAVMFTLVTTFGSAQVLRCCQEAK
jgi:hypothetical protein